MSAVGVTDWFERYRIDHGKRPPQKNLVFDLYPLEFLTEAQQKIGGSFFLHHRAPQNTIEDALLGEPLGTMLPLAHNQKYWQVTQSMNFATTNWSMSLPDNWKIQSNGTVLVQEAAILASAHAETPKGADGPIQVSSPNGYKDFASLEAWMKTLPEVPHRFAVAVIRYSHRQFGIILEGVQPALDEPKLILVKTGIFITKGRWCSKDLINLDPTNWLVL
jgi:hypothetical protein